MPSLTTPGPPASGATRIRPGRRNALRQALALQERVYEEAIKADVKAADLAQLARAWDVIEDRKRILRGRPLPGSLKPKPRDPRDALRFQGPDFAHPVEAEPEDVAPAETENGEQG